MIELNIANLRKSALIRFSGAPDGHVFLVREETQGDRLELSEINRKRTELFIEATEVQQKYLSLSEEEQKKLDREAVEKETKPILDRIKKLDDQETAVKAKVFDDGGDQKLSIALYNDLSDEERERLIRAVVKEESITDGSAPTA